MNNKDEKPSTYTLLYWLIQDKLIRPDLLFDVLELFWPAFIKKDRYIFLKKSFSEEEYSRLINENTNPEYWINLLTIDEFFSEMCDWEEKSEIFSKALVSIWSLKLKKDFPDKVFRVKFLRNEEYGDYGLTFYQINMNDNYQLNNDSNQILSPNIKESKIELSSNGPRPGIPRIRKPRANEIPQES